MKLEDVKKLKVGEPISFAGILSSDVRHGKFVRIIDDYLVEVDYGDHTEQNHITNLFIEEA